MIGVDIQRSPCKRPRGAGKFLGQVLMCPEFQWSRQTVKSIWIFWSDPERNPNVLFIFILIVEQ